jgi:hypothetical protein
MKSIYGFGKLAEEHCNERLPLQICKSQAGFYIGTMSDEAEDGFGPCSRESHEYFATSEQAQSALEKGNWSQRDTP